MSDLLFPIFLFPLMIQLLYIDSWLIGGPLGQALCKLTYFLADVSTVVSIQSLVLIAVDRFGAVVFPLRSPLISSKLCPFFILATWTVAMAIQSPEHVAFRLAEYSGRLECSRHWNEAFGESSSFESYSASIIVLFYLVPLALITILYIIIYTKLKSQKDSLQIIGQRWRTTPAKGTKCVEAIHCYCVSFRSILAVSRYIVVTCLELFASDIWSCGFLYFITVARFMAQANCAINPCVCRIFSRNYREGLKTLFG